LLARRALQVVGTAVSGAFLSILTSAACARLAQLSSRELALSLCARSFTTPLAMETCKLLGVHPPALGLLAAFATGLIAFPCGKALLKALRVTDPATRGLSLAGAAHGAGLLSLADEPEAFPFAALMMNLSGAAAVCLVSIPAVRRLVVTIALG
jgi:putative effector of murein hydrolase